MERDESTQEQERSSDDDAVESSGGEGKTAWEEYSGDKKCPECGEPIIDVRASCPNCGYDYSKEDYTDEEAGSEFVAGSAVDEEGKELPEDETGGADEQGDAPEVAVSDDEKQDGGH
ncbi:MAG: zinc-ribbon domain-containing protein [Actinomycetota bacterium]|nr:zinc-ribbon domain-containing protein [Actinomycetota bacterium]